MPQPLGWVDQERRIVAASRLRGVVALDGPSGTGKSTVAKRLARRWSAGYLDTGSMYRAVTLAVLNAGTDPADVALATIAVAEARLRVGVDPSAPAIELDGGDVSAEIRGPEVTAAVSAVSAIADVRELLVAAQRRIVSRVLADRGGVVVEGRDIGSVVVPEAEMKLYLTASDDARALRRSRQDTVAGRGCSVESTLTDVRRRDELDSTRAASPLRQSDDAIAVDTTDLDAAAVVDLVDSMAAERCLLRDVAEPR
jgi:cytidylate kinase